MGKLRVLSGREACAILEQYGFREVRRRSSHIIMQRQEADGTDTTTVPVPDYKELRVETLQAIIRQSGVPRAAFETD